MKDKLVMHELLKMKTVYIILDVDSSNSMVMGLYDGIWYSLHSKDIGTISSNLY